MSKKTDGIPLAEATHVYIGRLPCKCMVAVVVDEQSKSTAKDVAAFIRSGYTVERVTFEDYRKIHLGCRCVKASEFRKAGK